MTTLLHTHDGAPVAIVMAHGQVFTGYGATQAEALRAAQAQATAHTRREIARAIGLTLSVLSLLALTLRYL